jgi:hypothetical protein
MKVDTSDIKSVLLGIQELADIAYGHFARQAELTAKRCQCCGHVKESDGWSEAQKLHGIKGKVDNIIRSLKT